MIQTYIILFFGLVFTVSAQVLMKYGASKSGPIEFSARNLLGLVPQVFTNVHLFLGLIFLGVGFFLWLVVLSRLKLSVAIPFTSLNYVLILFFSWLFLKEAITLPQFLGVGLIIVGLVLVAR